MRGLVDYYLDAGPGIVIGGGRNTRRYTVGEEPDFVKYEETIVTESVIWVGLTKAAAKNQTALNEQPRLENGDADPNATFSWSYREDQRVVGSYVLQRDYEKKITNAVEFAPTPNLGDAPQLSPGGRVSIGNVTDAGLFPGDVTITKSHPSARLFYRVRAAQRAGSNNGSRFGATFASSAFSETSQSSVVVNVNAPETPETFIRTANASSNSFGTWRRIVRIDAYEQITQTNTPSGEPVTVTSPTVTRYYHSGALSVAIPTINISPGGANPPSSTAHIGSLPYNVSASSNAPSGHTFFGRGAWGRNTGSGGHLASATYAVGSYTSLSGNSYSIGLGPRDLLIAINNPLTYAFCFRLDIKVQFSNSAGVFEYADTRFYTQYP